MNLRPREPSKDINPALRYQSNNYIEKIAQVINGRNAGNSYINKEAFSSNIKNKYGALAKNLIPVTAKNSMVFDLETKRGKTRSGGKTSGNATPKPVLDSEESRKPSGLGNYTKPPATAEKPKDQMGSGSPTRLARPKYLLPTLHEKTYFKAAIEYSLGD